MLIPRAEQGEQAGLVADAAHGAHLGAPKRQTIPGANTIGPKDVAMQNQAAGQRTGLGSGQGAGQGAEAGAPKLQTIPQANAAGPMDAERA
jgi:hypothetical protein